MSPRRALALMAAAAAAVLALAACGAGGPAARADGRLGVVASFYPLQYLAEQIGGPHVAVTDLTSPGVEPHDLELSPRQVASVGSAGLVVYLKGLQPAVDEAVRQSGARRVVEASSLTPLADHHLDEGGDGAGGSGDRAAGAAAEPHAHATGDPHVWLDPARYAVLARGVGRGLAEADPAHAADYRRRTDRMVARLAALDAEFRTGLAPYRGRDFVTSHAAFGYLADRYGIRQVAVSGVDPESEPSPARLAAIQRQARAHGVTTVFFETLSNPKLAATLAADLHLRTAVLDPVEGVKDPSRDDYFSVQRQNLKNLETAFGGAR
ncbi:metal ABC transporter substrate-binding protein [Streptacidiphilus sp. ASG 303]|uniref:metal ABC transporter substrate-binding protein n=1 Tax=Streptacidiphilus sp. ASG 303 TaxID=2896847 RepID=UPI001E2B2714|nr:metal ABC transporter substrate-binding protein [Streptacidiphilus sp. ASG 303]MCD0482667.1 metal ABC transporter substrate-binding protein [Streptacidiphilus sp. ASG 303]